MSLGLSHSLSRHKLKFSPDKVDTMVVQAIALLDDLDKELNTYAMRVKEWYGWHFPEMARIINDNLAYARVILSMGMRTNAVNADLAEILPEEIETAVKAAAEVSMGTEITTEDLDNIQALAQQVIDFTEYRHQLSSYLSARMVAIAPNLTALVGELVGARLIAHAGSLMNLAKSPASTIQILGAEKALFRALKTKHDTPKYGLIFHASLVGQATGKNKAKIARVLAAKAAIGLRVDALADWGIEGEDPEHEPSEDKKAELGTEARIKIERKLAKLEGKPLRAKGVAIGPNGVSTQPGKWEVKEARKYNVDADGLVGDEPAAAAPEKPRIQDVTPQAKLEEPKDVQMANGEDESEEEEEDDEDEDEGEDEDEEMEDADNKEAALSVPSKLGTAAGRDGDSTANGVSGTADVPDAADATQGGKEPESEKEGKSGKKPNRSAELEVLAQQAGLSLARYKRKLSRGEIKFDANGKPSAISKKDMKRGDKKALKKEKMDKKAVKRAAKKAAKAQRKMEKQKKRSEEAKANKKRKREEAEAGGDKGESRKKKKAKAE